MTRQTKAYIALIFICIVWGTTYMAIRVGVIHYPAFLFAGIRQFVAGLILIPIALALKKGANLSAKNIRRQMLMGFLMLTIGNGGVTWAEKYIPSGIAALLCSMMPIFAVVFNLMSSSKDRFNIMIGAGMLLGVCGVGLIFRQNLSDLSRPEYLGGIFCIFIATAGWALGSTLNKKYGKSPNPLFNSGLQLLFGGIFMLLLSPVIDSYKNFEPWKPEAIASLIYLVIFGSVLAYAAYMYVLDVLPVGVATLYAYINPLIAVLAGALFLKEDLNIFIGLAFLTIVVSVYMVNMGYRRQHRADLLSKELQMASAFSESTPAEF